MKTNELTGVALDWAVAKCEGSLNMHFVTQWEQGHRNYSTDWAQGGSIIERERIGVWPSDYVKGMWAARPDYEVYPQKLPPKYGPTPLIAAMRCFVASRLGDEVEIPEGLK